MKLNLFLLLALAVVVALNFSIRHNPSVPNYEYLPDMVHSVAYESFSPNPNFPDGKTLQPPVAGTIARGYLPVREESKNLWSPKQPGVLARGEFVFNTFCQPCHGVSGKGDGPVAQRGYPPPASLLAQNALNLTDSQIFHILTNGRKNMPSYAGQISRNDRWKVILYVRSLQSAAGKGAQP
jgi:mono/diheme cytochrome c family protein